MTAYYNEIDPRAAAWLRELIKQGHIAPGVVDERSIEDVYPGDLKDFTQCHFFAGIGGWSYALRLAGWPDDKPVWTGSCPCQPFSAAGARKGFADKRHLWPAFHHLIRVSRPSIVFGEQVAKHAGLSWFDLVANDLETDNYAVGAACLPAGGVGAPHRRDRLYWVAYDLDKQRPQPEPGVGYEHQEGGRHQGTAAFTRLRGFGPALGDNSGAGLEKLGVQQARSQQPPAQRAGAASFWSDAEWLDCIDGFKRPVEPGTFPLAHGVPARVASLRGYGNAIVPQVAAAFILAASPSQDRSAS